MKSNQVKTLALLILTFLSSSTYASHLLGGEITFFCVGGGNYKFRVTFYKNCAEIPFNDPTLTVTAFGVTGLNSANITCNLVGTPIDISPQCTQVTGGPGPVRCTNGPTGRTLGAYGAVSRFVYESGPINFNNVPAPGVGTPYIFFTNIGGCCRYSNNNTDCGGAGALMLRCLMYRYEKNGVGVPPSLLCDKAPEFVIIPSTAQIISNTDTVVIQNFAIDNDLDSLAYAIDYPLINYNNGLGVNCNYVNNYSLNYPFPTVLPVNYKGVSYPMNPVTGDVLYKPNVNGNFLTCTRVESWRCGQKISEIYRDFQVIIMAPLPNYPSTVQKNRKLVPPFSDNLGNPNTSWSASFFAGDSIVFNLEDNDYQNSS